MSDRNLQKKKHIEAAPAGRKVYRKRYPHHNKPQRGERCIRGNPMDAMVFLLNQTITHEHKICPNYSKEIERLLLRNLLRLIHSFQICQCLVGKEKK